MRSTMTRYGGGSPIFVPPNFTISAVTPDFFPSSLTAWMNAGGNENSRPHSSPTTSGSVDDFERAFAMTSPSHSTHGPLRPHSRRQRLVHHVLHDSLEIAGLPVDAELAVGAGAVLEDRVHVVDVLPAPQRVHHVVDERQQLEREIEPRHFGLLAEVDQAAVEPPARGAPLVFLDERPAVQAEA